MAIQNKDVENELTTALADLLELSPDGVLDIEMSWPPDDYSITFLARADGEEVLEELELELCAMFRRCWESLGQGDLEARAFLRKHDDIEAMDLASGEIVQDGDRDRLD